MKYQQWHCPCGDAAARHALEQAGIPALAALVLSVRGVTTPQEARSFLADGPELLCEPLEMADMDKAVSRIHRALAGGRPSPSMAITMWTASPPPASSPIIS